MLRVMVVSTDGRDQRGLRERLEAAPVRVLGRVATLDDALAVPADVIVIAGDAAIEHADPSGAWPPVLVVSDEPSAQAQAAALGAEAWGVVPADATPAELAAALGAVARGFVVLPPDRVARLAYASVREEARDLEAIQEPLTARERDVLELLAQGLHNREIAGALGISEHTVKFHLAGVFGKLGASTRTEAVRRGLRRGLVSI